MQIDRRNFLGCIAAVAITHLPSRSQEAISMYGLVVKLTAVPGKRDEMIAILKESATAMPGCLSYVLAKDSADENVVWVTEVWDSAASHDASLSLPSVKSAMPRVKPLLSNFERIAATTPVWGVGLPSSPAK
jgi:quinol monooxygenase YgiN